ncbi:MAG: lysophospholipid acyltransferase family protein [Phycisphaerae bacterium]
MKRATGVIAWAAYAAIRTALAVLQVFPIEWSLRAGRPLARGWIRLMPRHRDRAIQHLRDSFTGVLAPGDVERVADACLEHWTMFAIELACTPRLVTPLTWHRYVRIGDITDALDAMLSGTGAILVTGHYGHFELAGHVLACLGFDVRAVMRPLDNAYLNRYVVAARRAHGLKLIDKKGAMATAEHALRDGGLLCFIADQNAGRKGLFVDFFGRPASTYKSIGLLAMTADVPIIVGYARRLGRRFAYEVGVNRVIHPHEWADRDDPLLWITATYTRAIEDFVRDEPDQYLWIHRRWKSQPRARRDRRHAVDPPRPGAYHRAVVSHES